MNARRHSVVNVLATGVLVLVLVCLGLFWARWFCGLGRQVLVCEAMDSLQIRPSRLFPSELQLDPNAVVFSQVNAGLCDDVYVWGLGIAQYMAHRSPGRPGWRVYYWDRDGDGAQIYYDRSLGLMVYRDTRRTRQDGGEYVAETIIVYAGPDGVAENPDERLGRFVDPLASHATNRSWIVYDRTLRRFFAIDWHDKTVRKGPQFAENARNRPVQIGGRLGKNGECVWVSLSEPMIRELPESPPQSQGDANTADSAADANAPDGLPPGSIEMYGHFYAPMGPIDAGAQAARLVPLMKVSSHGFDTPLTFVLDASGRIDLLDRDKLEIVGPAGALPAPDTLLPYKDRVGPADVLAYTFQPAFVGDDRTYAGCVVAAVSREATAMTLSVCDPNGRSVARAETTSGYDRSESSAEAAYFHLPGAPVLTALEYLVESMHPPVLLALSYVTASHFEATAGYHSVFLLPESFVAKAARNGRAGLAGRLVLGLSFMLMSVGLAAIFAGQVACDCTRLGVSRDQRIWWVVATMLFGLPVYLTYRLTRPRTTLVTCRNCGRPRRPDLEKCHLCHSPWEVAELTPPAWRVRDGGETQHEDAPVEAKRQEAPSETERKERPEEAKRGELEDEAEREEPPEEAGHEGSAPE